MNGPILDLSAAENSQPRLVETSRSTPTQQVHDTRAANSKASRERTHPDGRSGSVPARARDGLQPQGQAARPSDVLQPSWRGQCIKQAQAASAIERVHALVGDFHLAAHQNDYVQQTVAALKEMSIDYVIPLHCTGKPFYDKARAEMPGNVLRSYTGTRFVFS
jgi:hypothetical protein